MSKLNDEWIAYVKDNKLLILLEADENTVEFLSNLSFGEIFYKNELLPSNDYYKSEIKLSAVGACVTYQGNKPFKKDKNFNLGHFQAYNGDYSFHWLINGDWARSSYRLSGHLLNDYFDELSINEKNSDVIMELFEDFNLKEKLFRAYKEHPAKAISYRQKIINAAKNIKIPFLTKKGL